MKSELQDLRDTRRKTTKNSGQGTQEFFTPDDVVEDILDMVDEDDFEDLSKTFLDSTCGNGNFLTGILRRKLKYCHNSEDVLIALSSIYGTELMQDNVDECKNRLIQIVDEFIKKNDVKLDKEDIVKILNNNIVCTNIFDWNYENWRKSNNV